MRWKVKARIQNVVALLPPSISYEMYYRIQRRLGSLRRLDPTSRFVAGIETWKRIQEQGRMPSGKVFLEVGTGRVPIVPLAYWLMGAERTISIDLNPYLRKELIAECVAYVRDNAKSIATLFGPLLNEQNFDQLLKFSGNSEPAVCEFLDLCRVTYIAPGDAADTRLPKRSIDFHTSYTVLEHIPPVVLQRILEEGNRIIKEDGLFVHRVDYSDHFAHSDKSISAINFLQYSDGEWARYANNRYMYMNRLRHDDFVRLFQSVGHRIVGVEESTDPRAQELLCTEEFVLSERFRSKPNEILAITGAWLITAMDSESVAVDVSTASRA